MSCPHKPVKADDSILEGLCPTCSERLSVDGSVGVCPCCKFGFRWERDAITVAVPVESVAWTVDDITFEAQPGRVYFIERDGATGETEGE